jgi:predicted DNA-binding transcriptional regulator AlpA
MARQERNSDDMLTKVQLGQALNVSTRTIDRWIAEGAGPPYVRLPRGRLRWRWGDVQAWLAERREDPGSPENPEEHPPEQPAP